MTVKSALLKAKIRYCGTLMKRKRWLLMGQEAAQGGTGKVSQDARYLNQVLNHHSVSTGREHWEICR